MRKTLSCIAVLLSSTAALAADVCKPEHPELAARAKVTCDQARKIALAKVTDASVVSSELEEEHGKLVFSFDLKRKGQPGIEEVQVDAVSGALVSVEHEDEAAEAAEAKAELKEKQEEAKPKPHTSRAKDGGTGK